MYLEKQKETENLINSLKREIEENNRKSTYFLKKITDVNYRYLQTLDKLVDSTLENNESLKILKNDLSIHSTNEIEKIENYQTSNFKSLELIIDLTSKNSKEITQLKNDITSIKNTVSNNEIENINKNQETLKKLLEEKNKEFEEYKTYNSQLLEKIINMNQKSIDLLKNDINQNKPQISTEDLLKNQEELEKQNKKLKILLEEKNKEFEDYKKSADSFEDYLISSYQNPRIFSPFSKSMERNLKFMEHVADYLCSIVEKSAERPLISVIMPVYNRKDIMMDSINSVLCQTYDNFELIIVDDASTDGTAEFLKEFKHEKIRTFFHTENKDCCGARNTGLRQVKGEYIAYLDSDNLMGEKFLEANLGVFLKYPDAYCVYSAQARYGNFESSIGNILFGPLNKTALLNKNYIDANCIFHKKEVFDKIGGFDETLNLEEDWEFMLNILNHFKTYSAPFLQSKYYNGPGNNRMSLRGVGSNKDKIRAEHARFYTDCSDLNEKINIIIPIVRNLDNVNDCLDSIYSMDLANKIHIIISNNNPDINLSDLELDNEDIEIIDSKTGLGFSDALNQAIMYCKDGDILILNQNAILTKGSLESMQKYSTELDDCGLIVSQQLINKSRLDEKYFEYYLDDYWVDMAPFEIDDNIVKMPLFYDGETLELKVSPFFCTYIKRDILNDSCGFDFKIKDEKETMRLFSDYIRYNMELKIYHICDAKVFRS